MSYNECMFYSEIMGYLKNGESVEHIQSEFQMSLKLAIGDYKEIVKNEKLKSDADVLAGQMRDFLKQYFPAWDVNAITGENLIKTYEDYGKLEKNLDNIFDKYKDILGKLNLDK